MATLRRKRRNQKPGSPQGRCQQLCPPFFERRILLGNLMGQKIWPRQIMTEFQCWCMAGESKTGNFTDDAVRGTASEWNRSRGRKMVSCTKQKKHWEPLRVYIPSPPTLKVETGIKYRFATLIFVFWQLTRSWNILTDLTKSSFDDKSQCFVWRVMFWGGRVCATHSWITYCMYDICGILLELSII